MKQLENKKVGHDIHAGGRIGQLSQHVADAVLGPHWKRDIDNIDVPAAGPAEELIKIADARADFARQHRCPLRGPVVVKTDKPQTHLRSGFNVACELNAEFVYAA